MAVGTWLSFGWLSDVRTGVHVPVEMFGILVVPEIREDSRRSVFGHDGGRDRAHDGKKVWK